MKEIMVIPFHDLINRVGQGKEYIHQATIAVYLLSIKLIWAPTAYSGVFLDTRALKTKKDVATFLEEVETLGYPGTDDMPLIIGDIAKDAVYKLVSSGDASLTVKMADLMATLGTSEADIDKLIAAGKEVLCFRHMLNMLNK